MPVFQNRSPAKTHHLPSELHTKIGGQPYSSHPIFASGIQRPAQKSKPEQNLLQRQLNISQKSTKPEPIFCHHKPQLTRLQFRAGRITGIVHLRTPKPEKSSSFRGQPQEKKIQLFFEQGTQREVGVRTFSMCVCVSIKR